MADLDFDGVTVLDISQGVAGPYCGTLLAVGGARVVKIEPPAGDWVRNMGGGQDGQPALAIVNNLGKRSVCIDAAAADGAALIRRMAAQADVVIENFRPGVMKKLGLDAAALRAADPALIYVSISGFGDEGPGAERRGVDSVLQACTGMAMQNREAGGRPKRIGMLVPDMLTGLYAAQGVAAALYGRSRHGRGRHIKLSLAECCAAFQAGPMVDEELHHGRPPPPLSAPAGEFVTADGFMTLSVVRNDQWERLCRAIGRDGWIDDPRYATFAARRERFIELNEAIAEIFATRPTATWIALLERAEVLCAPVMTYADFRADPQMRHMGYFGALTQPPYADLVAPYLPGMDRGAPLPPAPFAGEHTHAVLAEFGCGGEEIAALARAGVVVQRS